MNLRVARAWIIKRRKAISKPVHAADPVPLPEPPAESESHSNGTKFEMQFPRGFCALTEPPRGCYNGRYKIKMI